MGRRVLAPMLFAAVCYATTNAGADSEVTSWTELAKNRGQRGSLAHEYSWDEAATSDFAPWALSISGGGLRAEAGAVGVTKALFDALESGSLDSLATISSSSGGSWFNTQFAFSSRYYTTLMAAQTAAQLIDFNSEIMNVTMESLARGHGKSWETQSNYVLDSYTEGLAATPALPQYRQGHTRTDLLICSSMAGTSLMSDNTSISELYIADTPTDSLVPVYWSVPQDLSATANWSVPSSALSDLQVRDPDSDSVAPLRIQNPATAGKATACSSNALGSKGAPVIAAQTADQWDPGQAVCSDGAAGAACQFPEIRVLDAAYTDNSAIALNVGYLQQKFPGKKLRVIGVNSNECLDSDCSFAVSKSSWRSLFANGPYTTSRTAFFNPQASFSMPSKMIFAESPLDSECLGRPVGDSGITVSRGTYTTVDNSHYGVSGGTKVELVVLNANAPIGMIPSCHDPGESECAAEWMAWNQLVVHMNEAANSILKSGLIQ